MSSKGGLHAQVSRRTSAIVEDRDDEELLQFVARSRAKDPEINSKVRMLQRQLKSPIRGSTAGAEAKPPDANTELAAQQPGSRSPKKAGLTPEERQRRAAMAYIQQQEQQALAAVKGQKPGKKKRTQEEAEHKKGSSGAQQQTQLVEAATSTPPPPPPPPTPAAAAAEEAEASMGWSTQAKPPPRQPPSTPQQMPKLVAEEAAAAAARKKSTAFSTKAKPPLMRPPSPPQTLSAAEEAAAAAASAAAARRKIMELSEKSHSPYVRQQEARSVATLRLDTSPPPPAAHGKSIARDDSSQSRASRSVALSKPLSPVGKRLEFASPSSLSETAAAGIFHDLYALQVPGDKPPGSCVKMTYAQLADGLGKRPHIAAQLGVPTKTAQEYHLRLLFKLSDQLSSSRGDEVDSDCFARYFASGGHVHDNGSSLDSTPKSAVPRLWKQGLAPTDVQQQLSGKESLCEQQHGKSPMAPVQEAKPAQQGWHDGEPARSGAGDTPAKRDLRGGEQNVGSQIDAAKTTTASVTATLIHAPAPGAHIPETPSKTDVTQEVGIGKEDTSRDDSEILGRTESSRHAGEQVFDADEQAFHARLEQERRLLKEQLEAERRSMQEEVAAARAAQEDAEERAKILKDVLSHARNRQGILETSTQNAPGETHLSSSSAVNDSMIYATEGDDIKLDLILKTDFSETLGREEEFKKGIAGDVSAAAECDPAKVRCLVLQSGSVVAEIALACGLYTDGRRPMDAVRTLSMQLRDPSSILRNGKYTHNAAGLRLRNPEPTLGSLQTQEGFLSTEGGEPATDGDMSRDEWIENFGVALEDAVNRSSVDRSSLSSSSRNTSFTSSQAGDKSASRSARSSFGQDANDSKRDSFNLSYRDSVISNRSGDSDVSDYNVAPSLAFPSSLGDFVDTAVNESLGRAQSNGETKPLGRLISESVAEEDCMEIECERSKIKQHVQIESILFGGDNSPLPRNGKDMLDEINQPGRAEVFKWSGEGEALDVPPEMDAAFKRTTFLNSSNFHPSLKVLESSHTVSRSTFRQPEPIWELPEAVPDDAHDDASRVPLASSAIPEPRSDASRPLALGASAPLSTRYEEFVIVDANAESLLPPALPLPAIPLQPLDATLPTDIDMSISLADADETCSSPLHGGARASGALPDGSLSTSQSSQSSFWQRVKSIGADKPPSTALMQAQNRWRPDSPLVSPTKLLPGSSPRVLPHQPLAASQASLQAAVTTAAGPQLLAAALQVNGEGLQSNAGEASGHEPRGIHSAVVNRVLDVVEAENHVDLGNHEVQDNVRMEEKRSCDEDLREESSDEFALYLSQHMQVEELKARQLEAHLPSRVVRHPLSFRSWNSVDEDGVRDAFSDTGATAGQATGGLWQNEGATDAWLFNNGDSDSGDDRPVCGAAETIVPDLLQWGRGDAPNKQVARDQDKGSARDRASAHTGTAQLSEHEPSYTKTHLVPEPRATIGVHPMHGRFEDHLRAVRERTFSRVPDSINNQENILLETFLVIPRDTSSALIGKSGGNGRALEAGATPPAGLRVSELTRPSPSTYVAFK